MVLDDKIAVIIGATGVIGGSVIEEYSKSGCRFYIVGRSEEKLDQIEKKYKDSVKGSFKVDVSSHLSIRELSEKIKEIENHIDILVIASGVYGEISNIREINQEKWEEAFRINLFGTVSAIHYFLPLLEKSNNGKIVTFAGGGEGPLPHFSSYVSSKTALLRFIETISEELKSSNIEINAISPGLINSGLVKDIVKAGIKKAGKKRYEEAVEQINNGKDTVSPERAAKLAVFLGSSSSDGLSGKNISAIWDDWENIPKHIVEIGSSDIYNLRRIKPKDRGYDWK